MQAVNSMHLCLSYKVKYKSSFILSLLNSINIEIGKEREKGTIVRISITVKRTTTKTKQKSRVIIRSNREIKNKNYIYRKKFKSLKNSRFIVY